MVKQMGSSLPLREEMEIGGVVKPRWRKAKPGETAVAFIDTGDGVVEVETKLDANGRLVHPKMERGWVRVAHTHVPWLIKSLRAQFCGENPPRNIRGNK